MAGFFKTLLYNLIPLVIYIVTTMLWQVAGICYILIKQYHQSPIIRPWYYDIKDDIHIEDFFSFYKCNQF